jgi:2-polyprenyl-6-methoxyphenol hydroxylase-like FAD-dependent oxidoreductase
MTSSLIGRQAVVVGAGMAGLPAARALADYFERVVVLERDTLPLDAAQRTGTPQARRTQWAPSGRPAGARRAFSRI